MIMLLSGWGRRDSRARDVCGMVRAGGEVSRSEVIICSNRLGAFSVSPELSEVEWRLSELVDRIERNVEIEQQLQTLNVPLRRRLVQRRHLVHVLPVHRISNEYIPY